MTRANRTIDQKFSSIGVSELSRKTGAELVANGIVGRNLETKQKVPFPIQYVNILFKFQQYA